METVKYKVVNVQGKEVGSIDLDPVVFAASVRADIVHATVRWQRAKRRAGTHSVLTKGAMKGGGRKPRKQKHSGTARAGSNTSPLWVGGGIAHGPKPRSYEFRLPKRFRAQALSSVLTDKVNQKRLIVVDDFAISSGKTKDAISALKALGVYPKGVTLVTADVKAVGLRSVSNIPKLISLPVNGVNVYDLMRLPFLVVTKASLMDLQERVKKGVASKAQAV